MTQAILITGAGGFIGAHIARLMIQQGHRVAVLLRPQSDPRRLQRCAADVNFLNLPDLPAFQPQVLIHTAWRGVFNAHHHDAQQHANVAMMQTLIHAAHAAGCRTFIGFGSQAEYGRHDRAIDETTPEQPVTAYGRAKLQACRTAETLCRQLSMRFIWLRLFASYGPMDHPQWLIPSTAWRLLRRQPVPLTLGTQRWDYLYVQDVAEAVAQLLASPSASGIFNLGSGKAYTIRHIAQTLRDLIDPHLPLQFGAIPLRENQTMHLQADISRVMNATNWRPRIALVDGLARTIQSMRDDHPACTASRSTV